MLLPDSREQPLGAWNEAGRCVMWRARPVLTTQGRATLGAKGRGCGRGRSDQWRFEDTERLLAATVAREARSARSCSLSLRRPRTSVLEPPCVRFV